MTTHYFDQPLASLAAHAAVIGTGAVAAGLLAGVWPFFRDALRTEHLARGGQRTDQLDGLRGILCLAVLVHHAIITLHLDGRRTWPAAIMATPTAWLTGPLAVGMFFSTTAFLFYGRVVQTNGALDVRKFLIGRVARIGPAVLVSGLLIVAFDAWYGREYFSLDPAHFRMFLRSVLSIASIGAINSDPDFVYNAGVLWTLPYEWAFYFALPILAACVATGTPLWVRLVGCLGAGSLAVGGVGGLTVAMMFIPGLVAVHAREHAGFVAFARSPAGSAAVIAIIGTLLITGRMNATGLHAQLGTLIAFPLIAAGATGFGLLRTWPLRALGLVSFSVYLLHGFAIYAARPSLARRAGQPIDAWGLVCAITAAVVVVAFVSYRWVEVPGIAWGRGWAAKRSRPL